MPFCTDCNGEQEIDKHGNCLKCGSSSIIHAINPVILLKGAQAVIERIGEPDTPIKRATLDFVAARSALMRNITLGQHLENTISMWHLANELEKGTEPNEVPRTKPN